MENNERYKENRKKVMDRRRTWKEQDVENNKRCRIRRRTMEGE